MEKVAAVVCLSLAVLLSPFVFLGGYHHTADTLFEGDLEGPGIMANKTRRQQLKNDSPKLVKVITFIVLECMMLDICEFFFYFAATSWYAVAEAMVTGSWKNLKS